jgi:hypothetical protein
MICVGQLYKYKMHTFSNFEPELSVPLYEKPFMKKMISSLCVDSIFWVVYDMTNKNDMYNSLFVYVPKLGLFGWIYELRDKFELL